MSREERHDQQIDRLTDQMNDIRVAMSELGVTMREGFKGVHNRQDITNGRLAKSENRIDTLEKVDRVTEQKVDALVKKEDDADKKATNWSNQWQDLIFTVIKIALFMALGAILYNGRFIFDTFWK